MKILADLSSVLHIRVRIRATWYLAIILITGILLTQFPDDYLLWQRMILGIAGSLAFLASIGIRQFFFNFLAVLIGIPLRNVTLLVFGGAAQVPGDLTRPIREFAAAVIGLFLNLLVASIFTWLYLRQSGTDEVIIVGLLQWLAFFWYMLGLFHFIPALPLEGGRLLLAVLWKTTGNYIRAMRIATQLGWFIGSLLIVGGIALLVVSRQTPNALLLAFFGWALQGAAKSSLQRATLLDMLQNAKARDIMTTEFPPIAPGLTLSQLVYEHILITGQDYFAVTEGDKLLGIVTGALIKRVPRKRWSSTLVEQIMKPAKRIKTVRAEQPAAQVLEQMDQIDTDAIPVLENDELIGIVNRGRLIRLANIRADLRI